MLAHGMLRHIQTGSILRSSDALKAFGIASLREKHRYFLDSIKAHGADNGGSISLRETSSNLVHICINNSNRRNAISGTMMNDLADIVDMLTLSEQRPAPTCAIVSGSGDFFSSGADFQLATEYVNTSERGHQMSLFMTDALNRLRRAPIVSVAVINGPALGGGSEILTATDFRVFSKDAYVSFVQAKMGVTPGWGGTKRLVDLIGSRQALRLLGTSATISAEKALSIGLADDVVDLSGNSEDDVVNAGTQFLEPFLKQPYPDAIKSIKNVVASFGNFTEEGAEEYESYIFSTRWGGADNQAAIQGFLNRKK
jgi:ethylmalonyl-CoA/methylmalonyl-CoA decarboxylase